MFCAYCGKEITRRIDGNKIKRNKNHFCNIKCKSLFQQKQNKITTMNDFAILKIKKIDVLISKSDIDKINKLKWCLKYDKTIQNYYIYGWERQNYTNRKSISLHRYIMSCPET